MGRGDIKTKKGKIAAGSFGKSRPAKQPKAVATAKAEKPEKAEKAEKKPVEKKKAAKAEK